MTRADLIAKYPGAPPAFIDAFLRSGYALRHFYPMRIAWQAATFHAVEVATKHGQGVELVKHVLRQDS